jgi:Family of unknown function (DUF7010)
MPVVVPIAAHQLAWFYPAMMVLVGAHYLLFATLYGMRSFIPLAGILIAAGTAIADPAPGNFSLGGWATGVVLIVFAFVGRPEAARAAA